MPSIAPVLIGRTSRLGAGASAKSPVWRTASIPASYTSWRASSSDAIAIAQCGSGGSRRERDKGRVGVSVRWGQIGGGERSPVGSELVACGDGFCHTAIGRESLSEARDEILIGLDDPIGSAAGSREIEGKLEAVEPV